MSDQTMDEEVIKQAYLERMADASDADPAASVGEVLERGRQRVFLVDLFNLCFSRLFVVLAILVPGKHED